MSMDEEKRNWWDIRDMNYRDGKFNLIPRAKSKNDIRMINFYRCMHWLLLIKLTIASILHVEGRVTAARV